MRFIKIIYFVFLFFIFSTTVSFAAEFSFDYDVTYAVSESGTTHVTQNVTITNNVTEVYAQRYTQTIASTEIANVEASDTQGAISPTLTKSAGQTTIGVFFNEKVAGIDKKLSFSLEYDTPDIAKKKGQVWEIIIPGIENVQEIGSYTVRLRLPDSFPQGDFSPPSRTPLVWELNEHQGKGITAFFGTEQLFTFSLNYHLQNDQSEPSLQEIALPPDTGYQTVIIDHISQTPDNVVTDTDGNWLARFTLDPHEKLDITVRGRARIVPRPEKTTRLTQEEYERYTKPQTYWEQTPEIVALAQQLGSAQKIYEYVVENLNYNYDRVQPDIERLGATYALVNPNNSVCMEFSDLFVALSRAAGIPSREHHGFAVATNERLQPLSLIADILHAWPEYYDENQQKWISVDPTWGNTTLGSDYFTKLDFNHFTFAILGSSSDYPYPAGSYKNVSQDKDVFVEFAKIPFDIPPSRAEITLDTSITAISAVPKKELITVKNASSVLLSDLDISANTPYAHIDQSHVRPIPPQGFLVIPVTLNMPLTLLPGEQPVTFTINGDQYTQRVFVYPIYLFLIPILLLVFIVILIIYARKRQKSH